MKICVVAKGEACPAEGIKNSVAVAVAGVLCCCECGGRVYDGGKRCDALDVIYVQTPLLIQARTLVSSFRWSFNRFYCLLKLLFR